MENATNKTLDQAMTQRKLEKMQALDPNYKLSENEYNKQVSKSMPGKVQKQTAKVQGYKMEEEKVIRNELQQSTPKNNIWIYVVLIGFQIAFFIAGGLKRMV